MGAKQHRPLSPSDAAYLGLARIVGAHPPLVEARHLLRWPSRSRPGKEHFSSCDERGGDVRCTCEAWTYRGACPHAAGHPDALAHHGVTFAPPPADPAGAARARQAPIEGYDDRAAAALDAEGEDAARDERRLDEAVAAGGDRWLVSRWGARWGEAQPPASPRVTLTCASCAGTYRFDGEDKALRFVALALPCDQCGSVTGPTPPAQGAARKPLQDHLDLLYGSE